MRKITDSDQDEIVRLLQKWPTHPRLTWEGLRIKLAAMINAELEQIWSRQSLSANHEIYSAFSKTKHRLQKSVTNGTPLDAVAQQHRVLELESALSDLQARYDILLIRHTQLAYNASLLEGGSYLLDDPLPDNTKSQRGR